VQQAAKTRRHREGVFAFVFHKIMPWEVSKWLPGSTSGDILILDEGGGDTQQQRIGGERETHRVPEWTNELNSTI